MVERLGPALLVGDADTEVTGCSFDSREVVAGDLFCCVPGFTVDGHDFAAAAVARGATAVVVERRLDLDVTQVVVGSVRAAMGPAAAVIWADPSGSLEVVGITGTNGKTTTAYMVESICTAAGIGVGVSGTIETRIAGVPEPVRHTTPEAPDVQRLLARMRDAGCAVAVMEVSSHALDQDRTAAVHYRVGAFTNLTQDHLDYHSDLESYFGAKARLFEAARTDVAVLNTADEYGRRLAAATDCPIVLTYDAAGGPADVTAAVTALGPASVSMRLRGPFGDHDVELCIGGAFNASNAACAAACASALGIDAAAIVNGLGALRSVPGRFESVDAGQDFAVVVDYAHTPDGVANVLDAARAVAAGEVVGVLGCGGDRDRGKRPLMGEAAARRADHVVVTSDNPRSEDPRAIVEDMLPGIRAGTATFDVEIDRAAAIELALARARRGDVVVIAGKGHETGQEAAGVVTPFDDRVVARDILARAAGGAA
ncbi:MAG: UDP-N-acetylmuramoyl-L-alanyl-D-glutamate--2,6-diaminopimelate ligase [Acidimicrobiia bacterium]|nr:UDP-N-acetylmuramoyl-L-alanyl-D-glutamate--2,6-diaminopimelate ligase [Acidimicrobiia bacterium]